MEEVVQVRCMPKVGERIVCPKCGKEGIVKEHKVKVKGKEYRYLVVVHNDKTTHSLGVKRSKTGVKSGVKQGVKSFTPRSKTGSKTGFTPSKEVLDLERVLELAEKTVAWIKAREDLERFISSLGEGGERP